MHVLVALVVMAGVPAKNSAWTWTIEDTRSFKVKNAPRGTVVTPEPHLGKSLLKLKVLEDGDGAPKKFTVAVVRGPETLAGRSWNVESNYGEAALTELTEKEGTTLFGMPTGRNAPSDQMPVLRRALALLLTPDPIVAAAQSGAPCDERVRTAVAEATAKVVLKWESARETQRVSKATAVCKGPGKYAVSFVSVWTVRDQDIEAPMSGTVTIVPGAWRAQFDIKGVLDMRFETGGKPLLASGTIGIKSTLSK